MDLKLEIEQLCGSAESGENTIVTIVIKNGIENIWANNKTKQNICLINITFVMRLRHNLIQTKTPNANR